MRSLAVSVLVLTLVACGGGVKSSSPPPDDVHALNLLLESGNVNAIRLGFQAAGPSADVIVNFNPTSARIRACPLATADSPLPPMDSCTDVSSGVRETIEGTGALGGVAIINRTAANVRADVFAEFDEGARTLAVRLPGVPTGGAQCQDQGCNPTFELTPIHNGPFTATASWTGAHGTLVLLQGSVLGHSATATGIPYREAARATGGSPQTISAEMGAPGEYALVMRQDPDPASNGLRNVRIDATWS